VWKKNQPIHAAASIDGRGGCECRALTESERKKATGGAGCETGTASVSGDGGGATAIGNVSGGEASASGGGGEASETSSWDREQLIENTQKKRNQLKYVMNLSHRCRRVSRSSEAVSSELKNRRKSNRISERGLIRKQTMS
jgi:hypothetical protein